MFSVWLNQSTHFSTTSANDPNGGKLVIGGTDTSLYNGTFSFLPILPRPYNTDGGQFSPSYFWTVAGKSISIRGGINIPAGSGTQVLVDTGTTLMTVDPDTFKNLITALSNNTASVFIPDSSRGIYACSCELRSTLPDIFINLGANGIPFVLTSTDYIMVGGSSGQCLLAIMPLKPSGANLWILGARFIQRYYTVFDFANAQVGFAVAADGRIPGNGQPLTAGDLAAGNSGTGFTVGSKRPSSAAISVALCGHLFSFWFLFFLSFWDI
ncbi:aspartic peptidase domain-containing protein [Obelidium mucronatum]|nr:aspartic peptidase domain-containing protein [Obelidium mucronatum]